jgi:hypothetical protein
LDESYNEGEHAELVEIADSVVQSMGRECGFDDMVEDIEEGDRGGVTACQHGTRVSGG